MEDLFLVRRKFHLAGAGSEHSGTTRRQASSLKGVMRALKQASKAPLHDTGGEIPFCVVPESSILELACFKLGKVATSSRSTTQAT